MMRYLILAASVAVQICLGGVYAWSAFVPALRQEHGYTTAHTQLLFGCQVAIFALTTIASGRWLTRFSPRHITLAASIFFSSGYTLAGASHGSFPVMWLGISALAGLGIGLGYICPLALCARWFPERKGLATGIAVAGFGGGAILLSYVAEYLFRQGVMVLDIFRIVGASYGAIIALAALPMCFPNTVSTTAEAPALRLLLRDPFFQGIWLAMFCGTFAGLLVIGNLKALVQTVETAPGAAALAIAVFAIGNTLGRIIWGWFVDRFAVRTAALALGFSAATMVLLLATLAGFSPWGAVADAAAIGFGFGANFVVYAALISWRYGAERLGAVYPFIFLAYGLSAIAGPLVGGILHDLTGQHTAGIFVSLLVLLAGFMSAANLLRLATPLSGVYPPPSFTAAPCFVRQISDTEHFKTPN
ncbi:MAG: MFS transporter [Planctomycetota bacterium]|nr:MFS transporter [Planctomycetota bacterium]